MRYRKLSSDGDYVFGNGQIDFYRDVPDAVAQAVKTRLELWLGEWFLDTQEGTPYMQGVLGKHSEDLANATIQDRAIGAQGVVNIFDYQSDLDPVTRALTARFTVNTIYGPTTLEIENYKLY